MDYVTDERNASYWRGYVGQSNSLNIQKKNDTLHYYVIWKGNGKRAASFIRLWTLTPDSGIDEATRVLFTNMLEMIMCRAFQTLPEAELERFFPTSPDSYHYSTLGLNVVPPLYQNLNLNSSRRSHFILGLEKSVDADLREWPKVRRAQKKKVTENTLREPLTSKLCHDLLRKAIGDNSDFPDLTLL